MYGNTLVTMNILGRFELFVNGQPVSTLNKHASKLQSLLCYLILHRHRAVTQAELIEVFYEDDGQNNPASALKMQIMRIRNSIRPLFSEDNETPILSARGSYQWNPHIPCQVDAEQFEQLCTKAEQQNTTIDTQCDCYQQALDLYHGDLFLGKDYLLWNHTVRTRYHHRYIAALEAYTDLLLRKKQYPEAELLCLRAIEKDPTNETLLGNMMQALIKQKKISEAKELYKKTAELLLRELGVQPCAELLQLYAQCTEKEAPWEKDLSSIMANMQAPPGKREAFLCDFDKFKSFCQLEVRRNLRSGDVLHVAMLTVSDSNDKQLPARVNKVVMQQLEQTVLQNLRQSDVVSKYSNCQFVIMLPSANLKNSHMVMDRIVHAYHSEHPNNAARLSYQIREPEAM